MNFLSPSFLFPSLLPSLFPPSPPCRLVALIEEENSGADLVSEAVITLGSFAHGSYSDEYSMAIQVRAPCPHLQKSYDYQVYNVLLVVSIRSLLSISLLPLSLHNVICPPSLLSSPTIPILPSSSFIPYLSGTPENVQAVLTAKALPLLIRGMDIPVHITIIASTIHLLNKCLL